MLAILGLLAASTPAPADLRPLARPRGEPPMRFVRIVSADPACAPNCPEWLSAEGRIWPGAAAALAQAVESLGGRRLPILIHSPGGSVADAIAMGELIRVRGLAVAVARTLITNCPDRAPRCPRGPGRAMTGGAMCASACVLVLAGGVERLVGPAARVGVHQITTLVKETQGSAHLTSTRKIYEQAGVDEAVTRYLTAMGVGDPVMALMRKTPAASIRWLSLADLKASRLATSALDAAEPIATSGANGLNARAFDGEPPTAEFVQASLAKPFGGDAGLDVVFRYRRGGGAVEAEATPRESGSRLAADPPALGWSLTLNGPGGEPLRLTTVSTAPAGAIIPRERFCALARGGSLIVEPGRGVSTGAAAGEPQAVVEVTAMDGAKADLGSLSLTSRRPGRPGRGRIPATKTKADATKSKPGATKSKSGATKSKSSATKPK